MDSEDSAALSPSPETSPSPAEEATLSLQADAAPTAAPVSSQGSVLTQFSESIQENSGGAAPVAAVGAEGSDAASGLKVVDDSSDSKEAILPVQEEEEEEDDALPADAGGEVSGDFTVAAVVEDDGNPSLGDKGETLAGVGEKGAAVGSSQSPSFGEDFGSGVVVGGEEEKDSSKVESVGANVKNELSVDGTSEEKNYVVDAEARLEAAEVKSGLVSVKKVEAVADGESPAGAASAADYGDVYEEALSEPLEANSSDPESAKNESSDSISPDGNVNREKEWKAMETESSAMKAEEGGTAEIDDSEASGKELNNFSVEKVEAVASEESPAAKVENTVGGVHSSDHSAVYKEALSEPLAVESSAPESAKIEFTDSINLDGNIDVEKESKAVEAESSAEGGGTAEIDDSEASRKLDLNNVSVEKVEAGDAGESHVAVVENTVGSAHTADDNALHEEALHEEALSEPWEAESNALESAKIGLNDSVNPSGTVDEEESKVIKKSNSINESEVAEGRVGDGDAENEEVLKAVSKSVEPAVAADSADMLEDRVGNTEAILAVEGIAKCSLECDSSMAPEKNLDGLNDSKPGDGNAAPESNLEGQKVATQPQKPNVDSEDNEREIESKVPEVPDVKENGITPPISGHEAKPAADASQVTYDYENTGLTEEEEEEEDLDSDQPSRVAVMESSEAVKQLIREMVEGSSDTNANSDYVNSRDYSHPVEGQIVTDSDEEVDSDEEGDGKELFDSAALAALLKAATGSSPDGSITLSSQDGSRIFGMDRPAGLGSSIPSLKPAAARSTRPTLFTPELALAREDDSNLNEEDRKLHEKVEQIRVKFLRLVQRLKHSPEDTVAAQVLYRLGLAEGIRRGRQTSRTFELDNAKRKALELEAEGKDDLNFSCNILVIGKTGVGKSATINSIFGEERAQINAFEAATVSVKEISGIVDGVRIRVIDTPGLRASAMEQSSNRKILSAIKKYTKKCPPDIVLYVDRLDTQTRDFNDLPLLKSITSTLGSSIWFNAIVALTHAASAPPDGPNGSPLSYEVFLAQRSHVVQHLIRQAAGDMRLMNPVALVENHPSCRRNKEGEKVLPNGLSWRLQMLLLCYSSKILSEANSLLKLQEPSPGKLFGFRLRAPPLPVLLSSLLQSRVHPKLSADQGGDNGDSDLDLEDLSDADEEEDDDEYDQLPPFKPLRKAQIAKLTKEQRKAYLEEYDYRVKLLQKKQWKEEIRRMKEMKKRGKSVPDDFGYGDMAEDDQDAAPAAVPVPLPDMVLPQSFDCDNPVYRYRFLEPTSQLLTRPVLDTHSWDHDCGYDGVSIEHSLALSGCFPAGVAVQITKDKKDFNIHLDSSIALKHGQNASTLACFEIQPVGRQLAYTVRGETKIKNLKKNKTTGGISVTFLGETVATGLKVEDHISIGKRLALVASTGAVRAQGDMAYGANLEARLRDKDFPIGQALTTLGLSLMKWRGDLALGANMQSQFSVGRNSKMALRVGLNNKLSGQITVKTSTSEQLQIALLGIVPIAVSIFRSILSDESYAAH